MNKTFATVIKCMDGRTHIPVINYVVSKYDVDFVDLITEPGPNKILAEGVDLATIQSIRKRAEISIHKHRTKIVAVVGHHDCAGNPASDEDQRVHLLKAAQTIKTWDLPVESVVALWVCNDSDVHPLA